MKRFYTGKGPFDSIQWTTCRSIWLDCSNRNLFIDLVDHSSHPDFLCDANFYLWCVVPKSDSLFTRHLLNKMWFVFFTARNMHIKSMNYLIQKQPLEKALACHSSCEQTHFPHTGVPVLLILLYYFLTEQCGLHTTNSLREINVFLWPQRKAHVIIESPDYLGLTQLTPRIRKDPWVESSIVL